MGAGGMVKQKGRCREEAKASTMAAAQAAWSNERTDRRWKI